MKMSVASPGLICVIFTMVMATGAEEIRHLETEDAATIGDFALVFYQPRAASDESAVGEASFCIYRNQQPLWAMSGHRFYTGVSIGKDRPDAHWLLPGASLLGGDDPCMAILEWSGGAHCCYTLHVFRLSSYVEHVDSVELLHGGWQFEDLDRDGCAELLLHDWSFAYWRASFASSPAPRVVLRKGGDGYGYVVAPDLMRGPRPSDDELASRARRVQKLLRNEGNEPDYMNSSARDLWGTMLDLEYSGHSQAAWKHFDACWPDGVPGKNEFAEDYRNTLRRSKWWRAIAQDFNSIDRTSTARPAAP